MGVLAPLVVGAIGAAVSASHRWFLAVPVDGTGSQRPLAVTLVVFVLLPLVSLWFRAGRRRTALAWLWTGALAAVLGTAVLAGVRFGGALGEIAIVAIAVLTGLALLVGALCQALLEEGMRLAGKGRAPAGPTGTAP